jgi:hypothetical protein
MNFNTDVADCMLPGAVLPKHVQSSPYEDAGVYDLAGLGDSPGMPAATTATMPSMVDTAQAVIGPTGSGLQPYNLVRYMPTIVNTQPATVPQRDASCDGLSGWLNDNPVLAGVILAGAAYWALGRRR